MYVNELKSLLLFFLYVFVCIDIFGGTFSPILSHRNHHHPHHVVRLAGISLTLSLHVSLSFIASGWSSGLHPVSSHNCCMYVRAGRPAFDWPYVVRHAWIIFVIGGR